jgi:hypothetical protein
MFCSSQRAAARADCSAPFASRNTLIEESAIVGEEDVVIDEAVDLETSGTKLRPTPP